MVTEAIRDRIEKSFARQQFMATLGAELGEVSPGSVTIRAAIRAELGQQHGFAHAGLAFTLGDSAAGYAALSLMPPEAEVLTVEMKINLLAPAAGDRLIARGRVIRNGARLVVVAADVFADAGGREKHVAALQGTMIPITR